MSNQRHTAYAGLRYSKDNVSILVTLDARRPKKTGLFPVRVQVVCDRVQRFYPTGKDLSLQDWNDLPKTKSKRLISIREDIKNTFEKIEEITKSLITEDCFTFNTLNIRLSKGMDGVII